MIRLIKLALFCAAINGHAANHYANNVTGSDANDGSIENPFKTFKEALKVTQAGDTLSLISNGAKLPYRQTLTPDKTGTAEAPILITGEVYITGTDDISDTSAGGAAVWDTSSCIWTTPLELAPFDLLTSSTSEWDASGVMSLESKTNWLWSDGVLVYFSEESESIDTTHIEIQTRNNNVFIGPYSYLTIQGVKSVHSINSSLFTAKPADHITLRNIEAYNGYNGVAMSKGGDGSIVEGCRINKTKNNGINFTGYAGTALTNTIIRNCAISDVSNNDCITLHKGGDGSEVGASHLIENNVLSDCNEQGVDVNSGTNVIVRNNITYRNGGSAIVVGGGSSDVLLIGNSSFEEGSTASLNIGNSSDVTVENNVFNLGHKKQLQVNGAIGVKFNNNTFIGGGTREFVSIGDGSQDLEFMGNVFYSEESIPSYIVFLDSIPDMLSFVGNVWRTVPIIDKPYVVGGNSIDEAELESLGVIIDDVIVKVE